MLTRIVIRFTVISNAICFKYVIGGGDAENGKSIKQLYGCQRKVEDQKVSSSECIIHKAHELKLK